MRLDMRVLNFLGAVDIFKNLIRFLETGGDIALLGVIDGQDIAAFLVAKVIAVEAILGLGTLAM